MNSQPPVWPAVPFSMLKNDSTPPSPELEDFPAPPQLALNGVSHALPVSPYTKVNRSSAVSTASDESLARKREFQGEDADYPAIIPLPPSLRHQESSNSPIIPLSADPFGRFPSEGETDFRTSDERKSGSHIHYSTFEIPPERNASLNRNGSKGGESQSTPRKPPSSRFSMDSEDNHGKPASPSQSQLRPPTTAPSSSLNPVKSIRKLWRKSNKSSVSSGPSSTAPPPAVPGTPATPLANGRSSPSVAQSTPGQEVVTNAMIPPRRSLAPYPEQTYMTTAQAIQKARAEASINTIAFDQESPYPVRRSPAPSFQSANAEGAQATRPAHQSHVSTSSFASMSPPSSGGPLDGSVRKSILKSWKKSPPNSISKATGAVLANGSSSDGRSSTEPMVPARKRRPSVIEFMSGSRSSIGASSVLSEIPPSPVLPEQYMSSNAAANRLSKHAHSRVQSVADAHGRRMTPASSLESSASSSLLASPPPRNQRGPGPGISRASQEDEPFEMIDTEKTAHGKTPSLSYPYHELDHQA